jgi:hypothetical protein
VLDQHFAIDELLEQLLLLGLDDRLGQLVAGSGR